MPRLREAWADETTVSLHASLRRCAAASAFQPVTPSPKDPAALVHKITPEVRKNLMLESDLAWARA